MKRTVKILALVLLLTMAVTAMFSCGKRLSGSYENTASDGTVSLFVFDGEEFVFKYGTTQLKGTYEIVKDGDEYRIIMLYDESVTSSGKVHRYDTPLYMGPEEGDVLRIEDDYITIGTGTDIRKYTKK